VTAIESVQLAHAGHVVVDVLTVLPIGVLLLWFVFITIRDRRRGVDDEPPAIGPDAGEH